MILRMPLKRVTPSFTVEYRQAKRPKTGSAKLGWAHAKPALGGADEQATRIAMSAFKTAARPPADVASPSILPGRILPSLIETAPVIGQADAGGAQSKSHGSASKAAHASQAPGDVTGTRHFGEHAYPAEGLGLSITGAPILRLKDPTTTSDLSVEKAGAPRSEKRRRRPAEKREKLDNSPTRCVEQCAPAPVRPTSGLPLAGKPSSTTRASRILGRYVFRDELSPGESWKRRIEARRERRA
jgi:hypothetical protein